MELSNKKYVEILNIDNHIQINDSFRNWRCEDVMIVEDKFTFDYSKKDWWNHSIIIRKAGFYGAQMMDKFFFYTNDELFCTKLATDTNVKSSKYGLQVLKEDGEVIFDSNNIYIDIVDYICIENMLDLESSEIYKYQFPVMILTPTMIMRSTIHGLKRNYVPFQNVYTVSGDGETEAFYPSFSEDGTGFSIKKMRFKSNAFFDYALGYNPNTKQNDYINPEDNPALSEFMRNNIRNLRGYSTRTTKDMYLIVAKIPKRIIDYISNKKYSVIFAE